MGEIDTNNSPRRNDGLTLHQQEQRISVYIKSCCELDAYPVVRTINYNIFVIEALDYLNLHQFLKTVKVLGITQEKVNELGDYHEFMKYYKVKIPQNYLNFIDSVTSDDMEPDFGEEIDSLVKHAISCVNTCGPELFNKYIKQAATISDTQLRKCFYEFAECCLSSLHYVADYFPKDPTIIQREKDIDIIVKPYDEQYIMDVRKAQNYPPKVDLFEHHEPICILECDIKDKTLYGEFTDAVGYSQCSFEAAPGVFVYMGTPDNASEKFFNVANVYIHVLNKNLKEDLSQLHESQGESKTVQSVRSFFQRILYRDDIPLERIYQISKNRFVLEAGYSDQYSMDYILKGLQWKYNSVRHEDDNFIYDVTIPRNWLRYIKQEHLSIWSARAFLPGTAVPESEKETPLLFELSLMLRTALKDHLYSYKSKDFCLTYDSASNRYCLRCISNDPRIIESLKLFSHDITKEFSEYDNSDTDTDEGCIFVYFSLNDGKVFGPDYIELFKRGYNMLSNTQLTESKKKKKSTGRVHVNRSAGLPEQGIEHFNNINNCSSSDSGSFGGGMGESYIEEDWNDVKDWVSNKARNVKDAVVTKHFKNKNKNTEVGYGGSFYSSQKNDPDSTYNKLKKDQDTSYEDLSREEKCARVSKEIYDIGKALKNNTYKLSEKQVRKFETYQKMLEIIVGTLRTTKTKNKSFYDLALNPGFWRATTKGPRQNKFATAYANLDKLRVQFIKFRDDVKEEQVNRAKQANNQEILSRSPDKLAKKQDIKTGKRGNTVQRCAYIAREVDNTLNKIEDSGYINGEQAREQFVKMAQTLGFNVNDFNDLKSDNASYKGTAQDQNRLYKAFAKEYNQLKKIVKKNESLYCINLDKELNFLSESYDEYTTSDLFNAMLNED